MTLSLSIYQIILIICLWSVFGLWPAFAWRGEGGTGPFNNYSIHKLVIDVFSGPLWWLIIFVVVILAPKLNK